MPCYFPLSAMQPLTPLNAPPIFIDKLKSTSIDLTKYKPLNLPCGQCIGCRLEKSRQWAIRMQHEASLSQDGNCFVTLTYDNDHLPIENGLPVLNKTHLQNFMKYLRRDFGEGIRFYGAGEYGLTCYVCGLSSLLCTCRNFRPDLGRPHYHLCLFNHRFTDETVVGISATGFPVLESPTLNRLWGKGITSTSDFTFETAAYCARYVTKKVTGNKAAEHYDTRPSEWAIMSRRPGLGRRWFDKYAEPVYQNDMINIRENLNVRPPKYYDYLYKQIAPLDLEVLQERRQAFAKKHAEHSAPQRATVRNTIAELKHKRLKRSFENV